MDRWMSYLVVLLTLGAATLAACGDDDSDTEEPALEDSTGTEPSESAEPFDRREGGEITLRSIEFAALDPHVSTFSQDISLERMIWRGLYSLDAENNVAHESNGIAAGPPEISDAGLTYTIELNRGLQWSDGNDLRAEDFAAGFLRTCNPVVAAPYQYLLSNLAGCNDLFGSDPAVDDLVALEAAVGVEVIDDLTIELRLQQAQPSFLVILALWMTFPVPVHLERFGWDSGAAAYADPAEIGDWGLSPQDLVYNGPYMLTGYTQGESVVLEPNENWSGAVKPTLDRLVIRFIDDTAVANNAYRTGEILVTNADPSQLTTIREEFADQLTSVAKPLTLNLAMQMGNPVLGQLDVRLALARAIDRELLNEVVLSGAHQPTTSWIPESVSGLPIGTYDEVVGYDPAAARQHLAEAGYADGDGFPTLSILIGDDPSVRAEAEFYQQQFAEILGIDIEIEVLDSATATQRVIDRQFELTILGWAQDYPDPEAWIVGLLTATAVTT